MRLDAHMRLAARPGRASQLSAHAHKARDCSCLRDIATTCSSQVVESGILVRGTRSQNREPLIKKKKKEKTCLWVKQAAPDFSSLILPRPPQHSPKAGCFCFYRSTWPWGGCTTGRTSAKWCCRSRKNRSPGGTQRPPRKRGGKRRNPLPRRRRKKKNQVPSSAETKPVKGKTLNTAGVKIIQVAMGKVTSLICCQCEVKCYFCGR